MRPLVALCLAMLAPACDRTAPRNPLEQYRLERPIEVRGNVLERLSAGSYLYLKVHEASGAERWVAGQGVGPPHEHQKCSLERVLGVLTARQRPAAHAPDDRPVPADEFGERRFVTRSVEPPDQFPIRGIGPCCPREFVDHVHTHICRNRAQRVDQFSRKLPETVSC
jgi:hypothetical protein